MIGSVRGANNNFKYMTHARNKYYSINDRMTKVTSMLEKDGDKALKKISEMNADAHAAGGIFILNPSNGAILVSPSEESIGKEALDNEKINGKAIVQEAIRKAQSKLNGTGRTLLQWFSSAPIALKDYYTNAVISNNGQLFVIAIGKNDLNMQRLFITKIVKNAADLIESSGIKKSIAVFNKENSYFKFKDTYIFIYGADKTNWGTCIYNPNFPQDAGKNMINLKDRYGYPIKEILKVATEDGDGWVKGAANKPGKKQALNKDYYVKSVSVNGKNYVVGSGIYLSDKQLK
jgi:signal transduction histidine kinase